MEEFHPVTVFCDTIELYLSGFIGDDQFVQWKYTDFAYWLRYLVPIIKVYIKISKSI